MRTRSGDVGKVSGEQMSQAESEVGRGRAKVIQDWLREHGGWQDPWLPE